MNFSRAIKICSAPFFGCVVKPEVPCRKILRHVKHPLRYFRHRWAKFLLLRPFLLLGSDVSAGRTARELWWTSQELTPAGIITMALHAHISLGGRTTGPLVAAVLRHSLNPSNQSINSLSSGSAESSTTKISKSSVGHGSERVSYSNL
jgi:hypothetical protein